MTLRRAILLLVVAVDALLTACVVPRRPPGVDLALPRSTIGYMNPRGLRETPMKITVETVVKGKPEEARS
jgi:hypothetical protein